VSAWSWGPPDAVRVVLTAVGPDGVEQHWCGDLHARQDKAETIKLPAGTEVVTIQRPRRVRVDLRRHRHGRWTPPQPFRPTWRDDSALLLWWRTWFAERSGRRAVRETRRRRRQGEAT
jgi:hypothetical protein